ncbi:antibiotic biosynthesis monooxygenase [Streptomyces sp. NRRL S-1521]|uniref:antibiotic biosynthesis monooxygenase n=1 Tax=Streptomyces sp. NRRL S-1521 TaxID=1609100 RepID=UPI0007478C3C|nr:antibiotic biosynthesis monooxygenase [Streptomyces sp. NRRL S-1521]KUL59986.1 antibiotic biosynthesis monooxygenase [Streptomyces sp. NRRL S-1521]
MSATSAPQTLSTGAHPDPARADVGLTFVSTWSTGSPERQRATLIAIARAWESRPWPHPGLLSYNVYAGSDGSTVLHFSQWWDEESYQEFFAQAGNGRDARNGDIDAAVPGIERLGLNKTRLYRSWTGGSGERREPGAIVIVQVDFDAPDTGRARAWADGVLAALNSDPVEKGGLLSAHFHISADGSRVVNYAEWESEEAHVDALAAAGAGIGSPTPEWREVREFPGVVHDDAVARYRFAYGFLPR